MSLDTALQKTQGRTKSDIEENEPVTLEGIARKFVGLVDDGKKKEALTYYRSLNTKAQLHIATNYLDYLQSAKFQF